MRDTWSEPTSTGSRLWSEPIPAGSRVLVFNLFLSHSRTCAVRELLGMKGTVDRLLSRGGATYALVQVDGDIRGYSGQAKWEFHIGDLVLDGVSLTQGLIMDPLDYTVGFVAYPSGLHVERDLRHAVPIADAYRNPAEAVCFLLVKPIQAEPLIPFNPDTARACPGCVQALRYRGRDRPPIRPRRAALRRA